MNLSERFGVLARRGVLLLSGGVTALLALGALNLSDTATAQSEANGLVVSHIEYALSVDSNAAETGACPSGFSGGAIDFYRTAHPADAARRADETEPQYRQRLRAAARTTASGENLCLNPTAVGPDPAFRTVAGGDVRVYGMDLDQRASRPGANAGSACAHEDFRGPGDARGVDNQFYRVMGCVQSYQPLGAFNSFGNEMMLGHWGILIALHGVDDRQNDSDIEVELLASADPIQVGADRKPIVNATYAAENDPRFSARARGRIVNGVLTTDPVDFTFHQSVSSYGIRMTRALRHARLQLTFAANGEAEGYLGGYTPIDHLYANQFSYAAATLGDASQNLERSLITIRDGGPEILGYTCNGVHAALLTNADGDRDPTTGRCTSISMQYRIRTIPAFVLRQSS